MLYVTSCHFPSLQGKRWSSCSIITCRHNEINICALILLELPESRENILARSKRSFHKLLRSIFFNFHFHFQQLAILSVCFSLPRILYSWLNELKALEPTFTKVCVYVYFLFSNVFNVFSDDYRRATEIMSLINIHRKKSNY